MTVRASLAIGLVAYAACVACGGHGAGAPPEHPVAAGKRVKTHGSASVGNLGFSAMRVSVVPEGTFGPYLGTRAEGMVAAWAAEVSGKRRWLTLGLGDGSDVRYDPKNIGDAAAEVDLVAIRPMGGGTRGFVLLTSAREFSGERVDVIPLGTKGELIGKPTPLAQSVPSVVWLDAVPIASGSLAMWAVRRDDRADIMGMELGPAGEPKGPSTTLVEGVRAWQVVSAGEGAAIAALTLGKGRNEPGPLKVYFIDALGKLERKSLLVSDGLTAEPDIDVVKLGERLVLAWSDRKDSGEPRLYGAVADAAGTLWKPPTPLGRPFGPQTVLRIVPPADSGGSAYLAWENAIERPASGRAARVATLSPDGLLGEASALIEMASGDSAPELAATSKGIAALTLARECHKTEVCTGSRIVPTFVQLDATFGVVASEPLRLQPESGDVAELAWGLECRAAGCTALSVSSATPSPVYLVKLGSLSTDWTPAARRMNDAAPPRTVLADALAKSEPLVEIASTRVGTGSALAWLTYFDPSTPFTRSKTPAPDGKFEPPRAILRVRRFPEKGPVPEAVALSYRADSPGGVAVTAGDAARGTALVTWVGIDNKIPQTFVTVIGPDGKKITQKMVSHAKTGVSDVATVAVADGFVLAWIDEGANASEIHVTKVDPLLRVLVPEHKVGTGGTTASSVQLLAQGDHVLVAWSDASGPSAGASDIYAAQLGVKDLAQIGQEHPLTQTPAPSRSPVLSAFGGGAVVGWVEDSMTSGEKKPSTLMLARLDTAGEPVAGSITSVELGGSVEGAGIECTEAICRVVAATSSAGGGALEAFEWRGAGDIRVTTLASLKAPPRAGLLPVVDNGDVFYADQGPRGEMVVRRLTVQWASGTGATGDKR